MFFFLMTMSAYEMRISDWSSDVCSSDLSELQALEFIVVALAQGERVADRDRPDRRAPHQRDAGGHAKLVGIEGVDVLEHIAEVDERGNARGRAVEQRGEEHLQRADRLQRDSGRESWRARGGTEGE